MELPLTRGTAFDYRCLELTIQLCSARVASAVGL